MNIKAGQTKIRSQIPKSTPTWFTRKTFLLVHKKNDSQIFESSKASTVKITAHKISHFNHLFPVLNSESLDKHLVVTLSFHVTP